MNLNDICKPRKIQGIVTQTPLIVPSFSSKGFPDIKKIHQDLAHHIVDASLVSAYDLYYEKLNQENIYCSDVLFIDSGGYERRVDTELSEIYNHAYKPKCWNMELYLKQVETIQLLAPIVLINYDPDTPISVPDQIEQAMIVFGKYPGFARDFLCKPTTKNNGTININEFIINLPQMDYFGLIGFTEKELGSSLIKRCKNLVSLRKGMQNHGLDKPIHIFGCIDPLNILAYFICGADVFDGLSWLRFSFSDGLALYRNSHSVIAGNWMIDEKRAIAKTSMDNLAILTQLMTRMSQFAQSHEWSYLALKEPILERLKELTTAAGVTL